MAERILAKMRIAGIDFANVITSEESLSTASWEEQPLTLRDDVISLVEAEGTEETLNSHENDAPEDVDFQGGAMSLTGSFIKMTFAQMVATLGGNIAGTGETTRFQRSAKRMVIETALRLRLKSGGSIIVPRAKGVVRIDYNFGASGSVAKYPFRFTPLASGIIDAAGNSIELVIQ